MWLESWLALTVAIAMATAQTTPPRKTVPESEAGPPGLIAYVGVEGRATLARGNQTLDLTPDHLLDPVQAGDRIRCYEKARVKVWLAKLHEVGPGQELVVPESPRVREDDVIKELKSLKRLARRKDRIDGFWMPTIARSRCFLVAWNPDRMRARFAGPEAIMTIQIDRIPFDPRVDPETEGEWQRLVPVSSSCFSSRDDELFAHALSKVQAIKMREGTAKFEIVLRSDQGTELFRQELMLVEASVEESVRESVPDSTRPAVDAAALALQTSVLRAHGLQWESVLLCEASVCSDPALGALIAFAVNERHESGLGVLALPLIRRSEEEVRMLRDRYATHEELWEASAESK